MPVGLIVMHFDDRRGSEIIAKYPEEIQISAEAQIHIISSHEYTAESGMISLMVGSLNIASYYTGPDIAYYVLLLLELDEDPDTYEGGLIDAAHIILQNLKGKDFQHMIPSLFQRISIFPSFSEEQHLARMYQDAAKRSIINRLRDEGVISKSELSIWLRDTYQFEFVNLDAILIDLIKREMIKESSVKGMPSELIFLTNDILMSRVPAEVLLKNPTEKGLPSYLKNDYITASKSFFKNYHPTEEDNLNILNILINPQIYKTLRLLRTIIARRHEFEKLVKYGVDDIDGVLKILWENQMIRVFQDKQGIEYYALVSDFYLKKIFPKYLLRVIKANYDNKSKANKILIEYLNVLEDTYYSLKSEVKHKK